MLKAGAGALSNAELLAVILRTGISGKGVLELSEEILEKFDHSLVRLFNASIEEIASIEGVGLVKAITVKAALELGKRLHEEYERVPERLDSPEKVFLRCRDMIFLERETVRVICLDNKLNVIVEEEISVGTVNMSLIHPRDVYRVAVRSNASGVIVVHNHTSGDPEPSGEDVKVTKVLREAGEILGINLVDHVIVSKRGYYSFKREGRI